MSTPSIVAIANALIFVAGMVAIVALVQDSHDGWAVVVLIATALCMMRYDTNK